MGLTSEMKNLSEEIIASFKQRIQEAEERTKKNEELVTEVQKTLDGFRKDHQEMAAILNANAAALRKNLALGEKERLNASSELMAGIHRTIGSIQKEVVAIQTSTFSLINEFTAERAQMAIGLSEFFNQGKADRMGNEKNRMIEFDALMKNIDDDIKSINDEVSDIFKSTNNMLEKFEKEHLEMSAELRAELSKNLAERIEYTKTLLNGFQKRLSEISKENLKIAQKLRKDLANGETERLGEYKEIMKGIHVSIKGIRKEIKDAQKAIAGMLGDFSKDRSQASAELGKMQETIAQLKGKGTIATPKVVIKKTEKKEAKKEIPAIKSEETPVEAPIEKVVETVVDAQAANIPSKTPQPIAAMTLEDKVLDYISKHPSGVRISEMEEPLGETRMKLGFIARNLLDSGKVQKVDNIYFPIK